MTRQIHTKLLQYATENWKAAKQLNKTATHVSRDDKQKMKTLCQSLMSSILKMKVSQLFNFHWIVLHKIYAMLHVLV